MALTTSLTITACRERQKLQVDADATAGGLGFEQARAYAGPDGRLHLTGHDHGDDGVPHFIADASDGLAGPWAFAGYLANFSQQVAGGSGEATPVWPAGAVPGDEAPPPEYFLTFAGDPLALVLMRAEWEWDSRDRPHPA